MSKEFTAETNFYARRSAASARPGRRLADLLREQGTDERADTAPAVPTPPAAEECTLPVEEAPDPTPPTIDRDAIDAEIAARVREAREAVVAELRAEQATALNAATVTLAEAMSREAAGRTAALEKDATTIARLVGAIAHTVVPHAARGLPLDDLAEALQGLLARLDVPAEIEVAVHPSLRQDLADHLATLPEASGFSDRMQVVADPSLDVGDARVRWPSGQAERDVGHMIDEAVVLCASWLEAPNSNRTHIATPPIPEGIPS